MRDDLIGLILGCGCRKRCCCDKPEPDPTPEGGNLFAQKGRGTPPLRVAEDSPFIPPPPQFDSPQRPGSWTGRVT
ncbi:hypothetical protein [Deinococcus humi]|uniref:Uncharacterized protein n=1 Tax=Deinococcus humi TaxID=662880 RepID=A0A7W8JRW0_9DEIO|nr:hypothetical protein [Deinococcus humi]MBB5362062.1 hypothetical protein [Deinococcus humi]GGO22268.1 hypothetical protein GCM10008949_09330 [Deinococcus humi]